MKKLKVSIPLKKKAWIVVFALFLVIPSSVFAVNKGYSHFQVKQIVNEAKILSAAGKFKEAIAVLSLTEDKWATKSLKGEIVFELEKNRDIEAQAQDATESGVIIESPAQSPISTPMSILEPKKAPVVIYEEPSQVPSYVETYVPLENSQIDSATYIELCKTKAETHRTQVRTGLVLIYSQQNPEVMELGKASTLGEVKDIAIKYGKYTEGDFDSSPTLIENYFNYLHNWAQKQVADYMAVVDGKGDLAYNDYYSRCLNNEEGY